ncbi:glucose-1-phosphate cytidylyltransferase [Amycolatopsis sp. K13G38]|uniref:Glucose-1-phosphate cytidylyltransferase n=1 Tax=Amycolatopsis acididurans TaxID=2724524 RepID=A0ABX1IZ62_9PSEU|nr:glucose-1-phosphate cytidylyltransferase [Amycolatopsis acididurans]NKQ52815.1 glucose-1-phosphate cytidylyltransferase [Amycolatopsis acididurans]
MKVVLFCGGHGMRMSHPRPGLPGEGAAAPRVHHEPADDVPKPMQLVGQRPLLWHVMRYYAHFGHTDFVLCLGDGARHITDFFLTYTETASNDFVLRGGQVELLSTDISDWSVTFVHTGAASSIGERLRRVREHVEGEEIFLANYADVLTDAPLDDMIANFAAADAGASMMVVPPQSTFHCVELDGTWVRTISSVSSLPVWENAGFFVLRQEIFDHIPEGGDLVEDACGTLAGKGRLIAYPYRGFWQAADTFKERAALDAAYDSGSRPWMVWEKSVGAGV